MVGSSIFHSVGSGEGKKKKLEGKSIDLPKIIKMVKDVPAPKGLTKGKSSRSFGKATPTLWTRYYYRERREPTLPATLCSATRCMCGVSYFPWDGHFLHIAGVNVPSTTSTKFL